MALNLQIDNAVSTTAQTVKDQNGKASPLTLSTDKVGIGTTAPSAKLNIDPQGPGGIVIGNPDTGAGGFTSLLLDINAEKAGHARIQCIKSSGTEWGVLSLNQHGGNVGIGTPNPQANLHVKGGTIVFDLSLSGGGQLLIGNNPNDNKIFLEGFSSDGNGPASEMLITGRYPEPLPLFSVIANTSRFSGDIETSGDIRLTNADCAEDFDICETEQIEPGTVMVLGEEGKLEQSQKAYDKRVAGVISGAGDYKPGIVLDKQQSSHTRKPIALLGKVYCKVDAGHGAIEIGDLLTTSPMPGHAMKADDPLKAFGTVIGKALRPLAAGQGLIPILIALQ